MINNLKNWTQHNSTLDYFVALHTVSAIITLLLFTIDRFVLFFDLKLLTMHILLLLVIKKFVVRSKQLWIHSPFVVHRILKCKTIRIVWIIRIIHSIPYSNCRKILLVEIEWICLIRFELIHTHTIHSIESNRIECIHSHSNCLFSFGSLDK